MLELLPETARDAAARLLRGHDPGDVLIEAAGGRVKSVDELLRYEM